MHTGCGQLIIYYEGVCTVSELLNNNRNPKDLPHDHYILELLRIVLDNNNYDFNYRHFHQVAGTAVGKKLAPSYANFLMSHFEDQYVYTFQLHPIMCKKFIDNIFPLWTHGHDESPTWILYTLP